MECHCVQPHQTEDQDAIVKRRNSSKRFSITSQLFWIRTRKKLFLQCLMNGRSSLGFRRFNQRQAKSNLLLPREDNTSRLKHYSTVYLVTTSKATLAIVKQVLLTATDIHGKKAINHCVHDLVCLSCVGIIGVCSCFWRCLLIGAQMACKEACTNKKRDVMSIHQQSRYVSASAFILQ